MTTTYAIVGDGWRAQFFHRLAAELPDEFRVAGVVVRSDVAAARVAEQSGARTFRSLDDLVAADRPDFVICAVPPTAAPELVAELDRRGLPVLMETPPAADLDGLRRLWSQVGASRRVQMAEQYLRMPGHSARQALIDSGALGTVGSVQVSSTHEYHAISLMRAHLGVGMTGAVVSARTFHAPLVDPLARDRWTDDPEAKDAATILATIDFGGRMGLYDFTDNQWHNQLRHRRIVVRGSLGEIVDDRVIRLAAPRTILSGEIVRRQLGYDLDLDGYQSDHLSFEGHVLWRNPFPGTRFSDEELAIATLLRETAAWVGDDGPAPYPLAEGCQDHVLTLAVRRATETGEDVRVELEEWAR